MSLKIETSEKAFANLQLLRAPGRHLKATQIIQKHTYCLIMRLNISIWRQSKSSKQTYCLIVLLNNSSICWWVCPRGRRPRENLERKTMMSAAWSKLSSKALLWNAGTDISVAKTPIRNEIIKEEAKWHVLLSHLLMFCTYSCKLKLFQTVYPYSPVSFVAHQMIHFVIEGIRIVCNNK